MPVNEDGVYEVLLNGRQLVGVLLLVLLLVTVSFWTGHVTAKAPMALASAASVAAKPHPPDPPMVVPAAPEMTPPAAKPAEAAAAEETPAPPVRSAKETKAPQEPKKPSSVVETAKDTAPPAETPTAEEPKELKGAYLQVAAGGRREIEAMNQRLRQKSVSSVTVPGAKGLFRLLVGPLEGPQQIADAREQLTTSGFRGKSALLRKF
ncbi:MAG: SPOR domain-containing protein [Acidobacteria bacterium]|nr:SPOR domain-containing protein [Acidobacteriota bacterium]